MSTAQQRADSVSVLLALRVMPWLCVLSWHGTTTINSSLALGDDGFGPKRLAKCLITLIWGMMATALWSTALACIVGRSKIPAKRQGTNWRALARPLLLLGEFPLWKNPPRTNSVFVDKEGNPLFDLDSCCACCSCCRAGPRSLLRATLGGVSKQMLIIFFVSTPKTSGFARSAA